MNSRAYLMVRLKLDGDNEPKVDHIGIYGKSITEDDGYLDACLCIAVAYTYEEARQKIIDEVLSSSKFNWAKKYFEGYENEEIW